MFILRLSRRLHKRLIFVTLCIFCTVAVGITSAKISNSNFHRSEVLLEQDKIEDLKLDRVHDNKINIQKVDRIVTDAAEPYGSNSESQNVDDDEKILKLPFCNMMKGNQQKKTVSEDVNFTSGEDKGGAREELVSLSDYSDDNAGDQAVLVATLDGRVSMLNQNGSILWSVKTGKVFSSTISSMQVKN